VAIERDILGFERNDDVASGDVSACYFHFLHTGCAGSLLGVVEHNAWDIAAMPALVGLYGEPLGSSLGVEDLAGMAATFKRAGALERARELAEAAVTRAEAIEERGARLAAIPASLRARAEIAKARGDRARALADFESLAATVDDPKLRLELSKLYEHWVRAPRTALAWARRGTGETAENARRRTERLERKAARTVRG
jgi:hypothetical protein